MTIFCVKFLLQIVIVKLEYDPNITNFFYYSSLQLHFFVFELFDALTLKPLKGCYLKQDIAHWLIFNVSPMLKMSTSCRPTMYYEYFIKKKA